MTALKFNARQIAEINKVELGDKCLKALAKDGKTLDDYCTLYHVREAGSDDCIHDGYIGITTQGVEKRWDQHRKAIVKNGPEKAAWPDLAVDAFEFREFTLTAEQQTLGFCLKAEFFLRPKKNIAWNRSVGGQWNYSRSSEMAWWNNVMPVVRYSPTSDTYQVAFSVYRDDGTRKLLRACSPHGMAREESTNGLTAIHQMLLVDYKKLDIADAPNIDQINNDNIRAAKRQLGWAVFDGFVGSYVFADSNTGELLHNDGITQREGARRFGIALGPISQLRDTFLGKPKMQKSRGKLYPNYCHTLKYSHGMARLAAVFDANTNEWTFHKDTSEAQRAEILVANAGEYTTEPLVTRLAG